MYMTLGVFNRNMQIDVCAPSVRSQDPGQRRVLDGATRQRRLTRQLEALEKDNFQDDPDSSLPPPVKRLPHFDENDEPGTHALTLLRFTKYNHEDRCSQRVLVLCLSARELVRLDDFE